MPGRHGWWLFIVMAGFAITFASCAKEEICENSCVTSHDGDCDDGGEGAEYSICDCGTDCGDCGTRWALGHNARGRHCSGDPD